MHRNKSWAGEDLKPRLPVWFQFELDCLRKGRVFVLLVIAVFSPMNVQALPGTEGVKWAKSESALTNGDVSNIEAVRIEASSTETASTDTVNAKANVDGNTTENKILHQVQAGPQSSENLNSQLNPQLNPPLSPTESSVSLKPFDAQSYSQIHERYQAEPFVVVMWSLSCPPCFNELRMLGQWRVRHPAIPLVLISTDFGVDHNEVIKQLAEFNLNAVDNWIYADNFVEKLRFSIDPRWRGELPRTYLIKPQASQIVRGELKIEKLNNWMSP